MESAASSFDRVRIEALLTELGARLHRRDIEAHLFVVGGAAMALAFNRRRVTRDIDGIFEPKLDVYAESARMADELGLPPDWLNDGVKGLVPDQRGPEVGTELSVPGLAVQIASARYLFAMKAMAARVEADGDDLRLLAQHLRLRSAAAALALVEEYYGASRLSVRTQLLLEELLPADVS